MCRWTRRYPAERLRYMLEDSAPAVLLTQADLQGAVRGAAAAVRGAGCSRCDASGWRDRPAEQSGSRASVGLGARASGLCDLHLRLDRAAQGGRWSSIGALVESAGAGCRYAVPIGAAGRAVRRRRRSTFDVSVWEFFWPLIVGARLVMARAGGRTGS